MQEHGFRNSTNTLRWEHVSRHEFTWIIHEDSRVCATKTAS